MCSHTHTHTHAHLQFLLLSQITKCAVLRCLINCLVPPTICKLHTAHKPKTAFFMPAIIRKYHNHNNPRKLCLLYVHIVRWWSIQLFGSKCRQNTLAKRKRLGRIKAIFTQAYLQNKSPQIHEWNFFTPVSPFKITCTRSHPSKK